MAEKDDCLALSLSLKCSESANRNTPPTAAAVAAVLPFPLNLFRSPLPFMQQHHHKALNADAFQRSVGKLISPPFSVELHQYHHYGMKLNSSEHSSFSDRNAESRPLFRGIDVNRAVTVIDCDEEAIVSSPNSTVSSLSGKRSEREENDGESLEIDDEGGDAATRKKLRLSKEQAAVLEETFKEHNTLNPVSGICGNTLVVGG